MGEKISILKELFECAKKIKVPSYQRAYAWEEKQLEQFVRDMLEISNKEKGQYYFGHFILEETQNNEFEIIDGQQRITTFILFLMVCKIYSNKEYEYISKFETVDYDQYSFSIIQKKILNPEISWTLENFGLNNEDSTLSLNRIMFALNYFNKLFNEKNNLSLVKERIDQYVEKLSAALISTHITKDKAVAVQIFELQNTRGIKLSLIEIVKAILMKFIYLHSKSEQTESKIEIVRKEFSTIYKLEESVLSNSFRGELMLEDILLHHLRIVDDGSKNINNEMDNGSKFNSPSKSGNKEEVILKYIKERIAEKESTEVVDYIINLSEKFRKSVELISTFLPQYDLTNKLVGDVMILDKGLSLELFILLFNLNQSILIQSEEFIKNWEKFLFIRNFHDKYYRLRYTDNFEDLFFQISKSELESKPIQDILNKFIINGFRKDSMDEGNLPKTVANYIKEHEVDILKNAFNWHNEKMVYILYKYEFSKNADPQLLRKIMKKGRSVEHILPQAWEWDWIGETNSNNISEKGKEFHKEISSVINGLGNLLLLTGSENSSESNKHPKDKNYESCTGGSYTDHNSNRNKWEDCKEWKSLINSRGILIYGFLKKFIE